MVKDSLLRDSSNISSLILDDNDILIGIIYKNGNIVFINGNKQVADYTDYNVTPTKKNLHLKSDNIQLGTMEWLKFEPKGDVDSLKLYSTDKPKIYDIQQKELYPLNPHFNSMIFIFTVMSSYLFLVRIYNILSYNKIFSQSRR
jgi:hypothetical protein